MGKIEMLFAKDAGNTNEIHNLMLRDIRQFSI